MKSVYKPPSFFTLKRLKEAGQKQNGGNSGDNTPAEKKK